MKSIAINLKPLTESDLPLLHDWFQKPQIKKWYARGECYSLEMIKEKYLPRIHNPESIPNFIIYADNKPIGYIQFYRISNFLPDGVENYTHSLFTNYNPEEMAGVDMFVANDEYLRKGYATLALKTLIKEHVKDKYLVLVTDPLKSNINAVRFFERNGFKKFTDDNSTSINELMLLHMPRQDNSK